jgi:hypothetical protein
MVFGKVPPLKHIHRFGCAAYVKELDPKSKFDERGIRGILVGCSETGHRVLIPETGKIIDSKHVRFVESVTYGTLYLKNNREKTVVNDPELNDELECDFFKINKIPSGPIDTPTINPNPGVISENKDLENKSIDKPVFKENEIEDYEIESIECEEVEDFEEAKLFECLSALYSEEVPESVSEALRCKDNEKWKEGILDELNSMVKMNTWDEIERKDVPAGTKIIDSNWVLKIKDEPDGSKIFRARLTARGFKDKNDYDRIEKFAPVSKLCDVRALYSISAKHKLRMDHMDVRVAFLNGDLERPVYMEVPDNYNLIDKDYHENTVLMLKKALYGLKVSSKRWFIRFKDFIISKGFHEYEFLPCIFSWRRRNNFVIICLYVDDMIIIGNQEDKSKRQKGYS